MDHEEFLNTLFAENADQVSPPISGLTEGEAVSRWLAFLVMCYIRMTYAELARSGAVPSVRRAWSKWGGGGRPEDVELALTTAGRELTFRVRVTSVNGFFFRLEDSDRRTWFDASGNARREGARISIQLTRWPDTWPMVPPPSGLRRPTTLAFQPAPCCQRSLARIREITSSLAAARVLLGAGQFEGLFSLATSRPGSAADVVDSVSSTYDLSDSDWETWAQAMASFPAIQQEAIRNVASEEILNHQNEPARERFWTIVYDSGAVH
jgi:hypothetical protein